MSISAIDMQKIWEEQILPVKDEIIKSLSWYFKPIQDMQYSDENLNASIKEVLAKNSQHIDEEMTVFKSFFWSLDDKEQRLVATRLIRSEKKGEN